MQKRNLCRKCKKDTWRVTDTDRQRNRHRESERVRMREGQKNEEGQQYGSMTTIQAFPRALCGTQLGCIQIPHGKVGPIWAPRRQAGKVTGSKEGLCIERTFCQTSTHVLVEDEGQAQ